MSWSTRFLDLADLVASWSKDPSTQVGAVVTRGKKIVSVGYNGFAMRVNDSADRLENREFKYRLTIHSEVNAILTAKQDLTGCTIYCSHPPCTHCASVIIQSGIVRVITREPDADFKFRWEQDLQLAKDIFEEAEVKYLELGVTNE